MFKFHSRFEEDMKSFDVMIDDDVVSEVAGSMIQVIISLFRVSVIIINTFVER